MSENEFNWKAFQKHLNYSDEELARFKADPHRSNAARRIFSKEMASKYLIIEVVDSHGCSAGMKIGDRLVFKALSIMDLEKSDPWCAHALGEIAGFAGMAHDRLVSGLDPNGMLYNHFTCMDAGSRFGWGKVVMKAYVVDKGEFQS